MGLFVGFQFWCYLFSCEARPGLHYHVNECRDSGYTVWSGRWQMWTGVAAQHSLGESAIGPMKYVSLNVVFISSVVIFLSVFGLEDNALLLGCIYWVTSLMLFMFISSVVIFLSVFMLEDNALLLGCIY